MIDLLAILKSLTLILTALSSLIATLEPAEYVIIPPEPIVVFEEIFIAEVTAYTNSVEETDSTPNITASGATVRDGIIACPRKYPFGTLVEIDGREYDCQDRMALRLDHRFDIFMFSKPDAIKFGISEKEVKIIK